MTNISGNSGRPDASQSAPGISLSEGAFGVEMHQRVMPVTENGCQCAIIGMPRWHNRELAAIAQERGDDYACLMAYAKYGPRFLEYLKGHFALAIIDTNDRSALIAIDRIGVYGLYFCVAEGELRFDASLSNLVRESGITPILDNQALFSYLYFHAIPSPQTIYRNIHKLEPAQYAHYKAGTLTLATYWKPDQPSSTDSFAVLSQTLQDTLTASVARYADTPATGTFLSGGLDSSTVAGIFAKVRKSPVDTFSIGFAQEGYDELEYARIAARHFGTRGHEYYVTADDVAQAIPKIAHAYDEPFGNSSAIPTYFCAKLAAEAGMKALLAGDGGDELFAGNTRYVKQKTFALYERLPSWLRANVLEPLLLRSALGDSVAAARKARSYISQALIPMPARTESYNLINRLGAVSMLEPDFLDTIDLGHPHSLLQTRYDAAPTQDLVDRMLYLDWKFTLADNDLRKVNRMCELAGIRVHYPMLDDDVVDYSTTIPSSLKIKGMKLRYFYKEAVKGFLPHEIISKSKHGFGLPFGEWLKESKRLQEMTYDNLTALKRRKVVQARFIDDIIATQRDGHASYYGSMLWILSMLEAWLSEHGFASR